MKILADYKELYLKFLKDTQPPTKKIIERFFEEYDLLKDTHSFNDFLTALQNRELVLYLDLSNQCLTSLPKEIDLFPNLKALNLSNNPLKHTEGLEKLDKLEAIFIENAELDFAPPEIGALQKLTSINLNNNNIDEIPESYFSLPLLTGFNMDNNNIRRISEAVQGAKNLTGFYLDENKFEAFPTPICFIPELKILTLDGNKIQKIPKSIQNLKKLIVFSLDDSEIRSIPDEFCELDRLDTLIISSNRLNKIPEKLGKLKSLKKILIKGRVLKRVPVAITSLPELEHLEIKSPQLEKLPDSFDRLEKLRVLKLEGSEDTNIPHSIFQLKSLKALSFFNFKLNHLPDLSQFESLESLYLGGNRIRKIPTSIGSLRKLQTLILWNNKLEVIPEELGMLSNLITLDISRNRLDGLPNGLLSLRKLSSLKFDHNPLKDMRQLRGMGIDAVLDFLRKRNGDYHNFEWKMPRELTIIVQQYLDFFPEFANKVIGHEITLTVDRTPTGLNISINLTEDITLEQVNELFKTYLRCARESIEHIFNGAPYSSSDEIFMMKLNLQINHLKNQIKILELENRFLNDTIARLFELREREFATLPPKNEQFEKKVYSQKELKHLVADDELKKVLDILERIIPHGQKKLYNMIISAQARYRKFETDNQLGLLPRHEASVIRSSIRQSILGIIDEI